MSEWNINIKNFNGPLDVLLHLIKDKKVDILEVDLLDLTTQYLKFIKEIKESDFDIATEYLLTASALIHLKTRILLQDPKEEKAVEEDKQKILQRIVEYQQFKEISKKLRENESERRKIFIKDKTGIDEFIKPIDNSILDGNSSAVKLIQALRKMFDRTFSMNFGESTIEAFNLSPAEREDEIIEMMKNRNKLEFQDIFSVPSLKHFSVTLLAILDMARKHLIRIEQEKDYGNITILRGDNIWN
ncbi:MAG: segregation/condensation protein A [Mycoplasma sp.]|nr:segregation/condensation protein A [Mycoplasma sp.]